MAVYLAATLIFLLAATGLSLGVMINGKQIKGHCGGEAHGETCLKDSLGNKIEDCGHCTCDDF